VATVVGRRGNASEPADEGRMSLVEHLRELRRRVFWSLVVVTIGTTAAWSFYDQVLDLLVAPYAGVADAIEARTGQRPDLVISGVVAPFTLQLKVSFAVGLIATSPFWLYQLWAFVTPGLYRRERRYTLAFLATAVPLFLLGVATAFWVLPKAIAVLLSFTPSDVGNLQTLDTYLSFVLRLLVVFGLGYVLPVFVVLLNLIGVVSAKQLASVRGWIVLGIFVFAAVATPTGDPFNMMIVAAPITVLYVIAEIVCRLNDLRRARTAESSYADLADDEASPPPTVAPVDDTDPGDEAEPPAGPGLR
jgi:sec-independent protein translocase protein TatC